jgi:hypothetical protein
LLSAHKASTQTWLKIFNLSSGAVAVLDTAPATAPHVKYFTLTATSFADISSLFARAGVVNQVTSFCRCTPLQIHFGKNELFEIYVANFAFYHVYYVDHGFIKTLPVVINAAT